MTPPEQTRAQIASEMLRQARAEIQEPAVAPVYSVREYVILTFDYLRKRKETYGDSWEILAQTIAKVLLKDTVKTRTVEKYYSEENTARRNAAYRAAFRPPDGQQPAADNTPTEHSHGDVAKMHIPPSDVQLVRGDNLHVATEGEASAKAHDEALPPGLIVPAQNNSVASQRSEHSRPAGSIPADRNTGASSASQDGSSSVNPGESVARFQTDADARPRSRSFQPTTFEPQPDRK